LSKLNSTPFPVATAPSTAEATRAGAPDAGEAEEPGEADAGALSKPGKISGWPLRFDAERLSVGVGKRAARFAFSAGSLTSCSVGCDAFKALFEQAPRSRARQRNSPSPRERFAAESISVHDATRFGVIHPANNRDNSEHNARGI
jgi:hypothetical protein